MTTRTKKDPNSRCRPLRIARLPHSQQPHRALRGKPSKHARQKRPKSDADALFDTKMARMQDSECWDEGGKR